MGNFSKSPFQQMVDNLAKGYVGIHVEQGVPVLDRDLNLLNDLISATVRAVITRYIGNGLPDGSQGFTILGTNTANDFTVQAGAAPPGVCLVNGLEAVIQADMLYSSQAGAPALSTPSAADPDPRQDIVYLDVWLDEVTGTQDAVLLNGDDIGMQTSVRQKTAWAVRVAEGIPLPAPAADHAFYALAQLARPRGVAEIAAAIVTDLRQSGLTMTAIEQRLADMEALFKPAFDPPPGQFLPQFANPGQNVTLHGKNFNLGTVTVRIGPALAAIVGTPSDTQIIVTVPNMPSGSI